MISFSPTRRGVTLPAGTDRVGTLPHAHPTICPSVGRVKPRRDPVQAGSMMAPGSSSARMSAWCNATGWDATTRWPRPMVRMIVAEITIERTRVHQPGHEGVGPRLDRAEHVRADEPSQVSQRVDQPDTPRGGRLGQDQAGQRQNAGMYDFSPKSRQGEQGDGGRRAGH